MAVKKQAEPLDRIEELVRLYVLQLRRGADSQSALILELKQAGFGPTRIAELVGTGIVTLMQLA